MSDEAQTSFGMRLVRLDFNPSGNIQVNDIKHRAAALIDILHGARVGADAEVARCYSIAITHLETAAMFAVKGATSVSKV